MLPTLLGGGNNLTISADNGTFVLAYGSEALISGPPIQACNVSGQCLQAFGMHAWMHMCVAWAMWCVGAQHVVHMGPQHFPLGVSPHKFRWLPGHVGSKALPCKHYMPRGVMVARMACNTSVTTVVLQL